MSSIKRTVSIFSLAVSGALWLAGSGCAGTDHAGPSAAGAANSNDEQVSVDGDALRLRRRPLPRPPLGGSAGSAAPGTGTAGSSGPTVPPGAQTPDGRAIPQASLPNGQCPEVVVQFGFWSCVTIGDQCTYQAGATTHHCLCQRVDGEGQNPAWTCD